MRNKIVINIAPKVKLPIDLSFFHFRRGIAGILDVILKLSSLAGMIFLLTWLSWEFLNPEPGLGSIYGIYAAVIILLGLQLLKKLFGRGDYFPNVAFDIPLLSFTTSIAISLFFATAIAHKNINVWGGAALRSVSGVAIIAYWFVYFLINANYGNKASLQKALKYFWLAPIVSVFFYLITFRDYNLLQSNLFIMMIPGTLWLLLTQKKFRWLHLINLILSLTFLIFAADLVAIVVIVIAFIISFLTIVVARRDQLLFMFQGLDLKSRGKFLLGNYLSDNAVAIYLVVSLFALIAGIYWFPRHHDPAAFSDMVNGVKLLQYPDLGALLMGNGLQNIVASKFWQFLFVYGLLPTSIFIGSGLFIFRKWMQQLKVHRTKPMLGLIVSLGTTAFCFSIYLLVQNKGTELVILMLVILASLLGCIYNFSSKNALPVEQSNELLDFKNIRPSNIQMFLKIFRILLAMIIFLGAIYLLSSLNYISIFVTI